MDDRDGEPYHRREGVESAKGLAYYLSRLQKNYIFSQFAFSLKGFVETVDSNHQKGLDFSGLLGEDGEKYNSTIENEGIRQRFLEVYDRFFSEFQRNRGIQEKQFTSFDRQDITECMENRYQEGSNFCPSCHKAFRTTLGLVIHQRSCQDLSKEALDGPKEGFPQGKVTCSVCGAVCKTPFGLHVHQKKCKRLSDTTGSEESFLSDTGKAKEDSSVQRQKIFHCRACKEPVGRDVTELKRHQSSCAKGRTEFSQNSTSELQNIDEDHIARQESSKNNDTECNTIADVQNTGYADSDYHNCEYCGLLCRTLLGLSVHQRKCEERRRKLTELYGSEALNQVHTCESCGRQCVSLYGLRIHQRKCFRRSSNTDPESQERTAKRPRSSHRSERSRRSSAVIKNSKDVSTNQWQLSCALCPSFTASTGVLDDFVGPFMSKIGRSAKSFIHVHVECALWAPEVYQDRVTKELCQVYDAYRRSRKKICHYCGELGASVPCLHKGCKKSYHYCCLTKANCFLDSSKFESFCTHHAPRNENMLSSIGRENVSFFNNAQQEVFSSTLKSHVTVERKEVCEVIFWRKFKVISQLVYSEKLPLQFVLPWKEQCCLNLKDVVIGDSHVLVLSWTQFKEHVHSSPLLSGNESFFLRRNLRKYTRKASSIGHLKTLSASQNNLLCEVDLFERRKAAIYGVLRRRRKCTKLRRFCWTIKDDTSREYSFGDSEKGGESRYNLHSYRENGMVEQVGNSEPTQKSLSKEDRLHLKLDSRKMERSCRASVLESNDRNGKKSSLKTRKNDSNIGLFGGKEHLRGIFTDSVHNEKRTRRVDAKMVVPLSTTLSFSKSLGGNAKSDKENEQLERNGKSLRLDDIFSVDLDESVVDQVCAPPSEV
ncbi:ubiquitin-protein ligase [Galdieria sulphuraria]|uniref:Ubiquitin-protein ligase n=1 Tax=Galdieria sulphuraria TaxID=130081 RepID=M2X7P9_GALSU|nr:ubiquitin-protein ligase [Galdieria sulphuraria]EME32565.1 ubiquitin-protein ligase [Galdieria sulphuraria]|eukprot:XP_005709085.1 ubiquitin-protein ligase [Galdieria sulphuraria]